MQHWLKQCTPYGYNQGFALDLTWVLGFVLILQNLNTQVSIL